MGKVRKLIGRLLNGRLPVKSRRNSTKSHKSLTQSVKNKRKISTSSHSSSNSSSNLPSTSQDSKKLNTRHSSNTMPKIREQNVESVGRRSSTQLAAIKR